VSRQTLDDSFVIPMVSNYNIYRYVLREYIEVLVEAGDWSWTLASTRIQFMHSKIGHCSWQGGRTSKVASIDVVSGLRNSLMSSPGHNEEWDKNAEGKPS
jgi:hypothetical protein